MVKEEEIQKRGEKQFVVETELVKFSNRKQRGSS